MQSLLEGDESHHPMTPNSRDVVVRETTAPETVALVPGIDLLQILGDMLVIIDLQAERVVWCSTAFTRGFAFINIDISEKEFCHYFNGLDAYVRAGTSNNSDELVAGSTPLTLYCNKIAQLCDIEVMPYRGNYRLLRFSSATKSSDEIQRYLEDREKLFSTSRTLSVSEMATTLAHELNQPIGTVTNLLQGIRMRLQKIESPVEPILQAIDKTLEQTAFAANVITRIRDFTYSQRPQHNAIFVVELLTSCLSLLDWEMQKESIQVNFYDINRADSEANAPVVAGDNTMLQQVFINLLRNAIDAMKNTPRECRSINIYMKIDGAQIEIALSDTGSGLSTEAKEQLFVPFVSSKTTGMGVGLNICRSFIEMHQGRLWLSANADEPIVAKSEKITTGCTAHVLLPLTNVDEGESTSIR